MNEVEKKINSREDCKWFGVRTPQKPCGQCNKDCQYNDNKTQKEIEEMAEILMDLILDTPFNGTIASCETITEALYNAGYGKVEDYKKEIEKLKEENKELMFKVNQLSAKWVENFFAEAIKARKQQAIKEFAEKLTTHIFEYLGVKDIQEASKLSLIDSTLTYDVVTDKIDDLLRSSNEATKKKISSNHKQCSQQTKTMIVDLY